MVFCCLWLTARWRCFCRLAPVCCKPGTPAQFLLPMRSHRSGPLGGVSAGKRRQRYWHISSHASCPPLTPSKLCGNALEHMTLRSIGMATTLSCNVHQTTRCVAGLAVKTLARFSSHGVLLSVAYCQMALLLPPGALYVASLAPLHKFSCPHAQGSLRPFRWCICWQKEATVLAHQFPCFVSALDSF